MCNAPVTFQRLAHTVLAGLSGCEAYINDIVVHSGSWDDHVAQLKEILSDANHTLNLAKCEFAQATVTYLGKVVGCGQVKPVLSKIEAFPCSNFSPLFGNGRILPEFQQKLLSCGGSAHQPAQSQSSVPVVGQLSTGI